MVTKEETDLILTEQNKSTEEILKVIDTIKADFQELCAMRQRQVTELEKKNTELKQENVELKCECRRCVYSDSPCVLSDYGKDRNGICDHFKDVFDTVAELRIQNTNANLKGLEMQVAKDSHRDRANKTQEQLLKAIRLLKFWVNDFYDGLNHSTKYEERHKAIVETEQLIKEIEND